MNTLQWCQWTCSFKAKNISSRARAETPGRLAESQRMDSDVITMSCLNKSATCFVSSGQCRWPIYPSGADGTLPCAWSWPCPALFLDWQRVVRSQPLSVRQALLLQTHGPRLILVPRFLRSPYAQPCRHLSAHASTHTHTHNKCIWTHTHTGMSDTSWPLAVPHWISRRRATCRVRGDFGVKELGLESSHIVKPAGLINSSRQSTNSRAHCWCSLFIYETCVFGY